MVKFADVIPGSVVQLGRLNKERSKLSYAVALVREKKATKIGNSVWTGIEVEVAPRQYETVALHNIKTILA